MGGSTRSGETSGVRAKADSAGGRQGATWRGDSATGAGVLMVPGGLGAVAGGGDDVGYKMSTRGEIVGAAIDAGTMGSARDREMDETLGERNDPGPEGQE